MVRPDKVAALLKSHRIEHVRLYDADPDMLTALANTTVRVAVSIPNEQIPTISQSNSTAAKWVSLNVLKHYPSTNITTICVGTDVLTNAPNLAKFLPNALNNIHVALISANLDKKIKISSPVSSTIVMNSSSPSRARFNASLNHILLPLLEFLQSTDSFFMINMYPYFERVRSNDVVSLDYALFEPIPSSERATDTNTSLHYSNAFDEMVDAAYSAMAGVNITDVKVVVAETGWPSGGGAGEADATPENARTYANNLVKHLKNGTGTPMHPGVGVAAYIYELYDGGAEAAGPFSGRRWGLFEASGAGVYDVDFGGGLGSSSGGGNETYCAAKAGADAEKVQAALDWACGAGKVDCTALTAGQPCFEPDTLAAHATYAFDSYYKQMGKVAGSCDFDGVATITTTTPSNLISLSLSLNFSFYDYIYVFAGYGSSCVISGVGRFVYIYSPPSPSSLPN